MSEDRDRWQVWPKMTRKIWLVIGMVLLSIPVFVPLGLPLPISKPVQEFYNVVEATPDGSVVFWGASWAMIDIYFNSRDFFGAALQQFAMKNFKLVLLAYGPPSTASFEDMVVRQKLEENYGYVYGEDYVIMPYLAGDETAMAQADNLKAAYTADNRGTPLDQLPLLDTVNSIADADLAIIHYHIFTYGEMFVRQWPAKYNVPTVCMGQWHGIAPWYGTYVLGVIETIGDYAAYETMLGIPGEELMKAEAVNLTRAMGVIMVVIGLIHSLITRTAPRTPIRERGVIE